MVDTIPTITTFGNAIMTARTTQDTPTTARMATTLMRDVLILTRKNIT